MTEDIEALNEFTVEDKPKYVNNYVTEYSKIAKACSLLHGEKCLSVPLTFFKTKNYKPSLHNAGKRIGIKIKSIVIAGNVKIWKM
jgi:hypothetical protein